MSSKDLATLVVLGIIGYVIYDYYNCGCAAAGIENLFGSGFPSNWDTSATADQYVPYINQVESQYGLPQNYLAAVAFAESSFNPNAQNSSSGAVGMFQLLPCYYPGAGQNWQTDAGTAATALKGYYNQFGDWQLALAAYNWGPSNVAANAAFCAMPTETQNYVTKIADATSVQGSLVNVA